MGSKKRKHNAHNLKKHTNEKQISQHFDACGHHVSHSRLTERELHKKAVNNHKAEVTKLSNKHSTETTKLKKDITKLR